MSTRTTQRTSQPTTDTVPDPARSGTADPTATPAPAGSETAGVAEAADPGWAVFSAAVTDEVPMIADRDDLTVCVAPGAGQGSPACFLPGRARIEVDGTHLGGVAPGRAEPHRDDDRARYPVLWGLLVHECAHARHSRWSTPLAAFGPVSVAAELLEEVRVESCHLARRPHDRDWVRAAAQKLILADLPAITGTTPAPGDAAPVTTEPEAAEPVTLPVASAPVTAGPVVAESTVGESTVGDPGAPGSSGAPVPGPDGGAGVPEPVTVAGQRWMAGSMAALVLARHEIGVFTDDEVSAVAAHVESVLGADDLDRLRALWQNVCAAGEAADDDDRVIEAGRRWCEVIGVGAGAVLGPVPAPDATLGGLVSVLLAAVQVIGDAALAESAARVARAGTATGGTGGTGGGTGDGAGGGAGVDEVAQRAAEAVFGSAEHPRTAPRVPSERSAQARRRAARRDGSSPALSGISRTRAPSAEERRAARVLAHGLDEAGLRAKVITTVTSAVPPGRLRMRGALAADAQRSAGAAPTARPFTRKTRRAVPAPPLRIGIGCDVSGSMAAVVNAVASTAWMFAEAAAHTRTDLDTATVIFGREVHPVTRPGQRPREVTEFRALDMWEAADTAIEALDGALRLSRTGQAARLLVIISDGQWRPEPREAAQQRVDTLRASGCGVLWLSPPSHGSVLSAKPLQGAVVHELSDPAATARTIATAAARTLRAT